MEKIVSQAFILLILFILLNSIQSATANSENKSNLNQSDSNITNKETISAFNNFNQQNDFNWEIKWNNKTGTPKTLYKSHSSQLTANELKGNPEDIAKGFLSNHSDMFLMKKDLADLRITQISRGLASDHIRFIQTYNDLTVYGAETSVHMNKDGQIELINNNYQPQVNIITNNKNISKEESISRAIEYLKPNSRLRAEVNTELVIYPKENSYYLAWKVLIPAYEPLGDWLIFVDATNGNILDKFNLIKFVDGWGYVFDPNPVVTSGNNTLRDNNNSDSDILTQQRFNRTLRDLDGSGNLTGPYVDLTAHGIIGYKPAGLANEATQHFNYTRSDDRFEEVNVYYHIDKFQRYIQSLGFINERNISNRSIPAHAHYYSEFNAFYSPFDKGLHFGDGNTINGIPFSGVDASEDADIILHEYGHAIQDYQVPGFGISAEAGAIGEGFGDYIAASFFSTVNNGFQRTCVGDWFATNYSTSNPPCIRRVDGQKHYPENFTNEVHADGEIWSASLWDIWELFGSNITDKIVLESNFYLSPDSNFSDGANAIILADRNLYGGAHVSSIEGVFENRGILPNNSDFLSGGWSYRKQKTINGTTAGYQINYQMKLTVYNSSGTDTPGNVYLGGNARSDFGDLRFTKSDGVTLLDYWIESYTSGVSAVVWIEVDYIPASPNTVSIYLYYGNPSAASASNGSNTFVFFDDFNRADGSIGNGWTVVQGSVTINTNRARLATDAVKDPWAYRDGTNNGISIQNDFYIASGSSYRAYGTLVRGSTSGLWYTGYGWLYMQHANTLYIFDNGGVVASASLTLPVNTWLTGEMIIKSNDNLEVRLWQKGSSKPSSPSITYNGSPNSAGSKHKITAGGDYNTLRGYVDNFFVRKYISPEPTWA